MPDRNNIDDIYKIVKEDFSWIQEDMSQHRKLLKEELIKRIEKDRFEEIDEYRKKCDDIEKLIEKIESIKDEYISIVIGDDNKKEVDNNDEYDYLEDWSNTSPEEILLFGKRYKVKFWRDILFTLIEELYKIDKELINRLVYNKDFKGRKRLYITYDKNQIDEAYYKKTSFGLYVMTNASANTIYSLCLDILEILGYKEDDLKVKLKRSDKDREDREVKIEKDDLSNNIKLPREYASVSMDKSLFKSIVYSIINRNEEYGTNYIEPRRIADKYEELILNNTKYTVSYHVVINIIKFLKDSHFIDNYEGTKKGKYIVVDDDSLRTWVDNNI